jgi:hypothetical protein
MREVDYVLTCHLYPTPQSSPMMPMAKVVAVKVNQVGINPAMGNPKAKPYRKPVIIGCFLKSITLIIPP